MSDELIERIEGTQSQNVKAGQYLFNLGSRCEHFVFVRSGQVRVELLSTFLVTTPATVMRRSVAEDTKAPEVLRAPYSGYPDASSGLT